MLAIQVLINGLTAGAMLALMAIGLTLIFGILGVVNFVHGVIFMLGAYATIFVAGILGQPYMVALLAAVLLTALFGVLLEVFLFKRFEGKVLEGAVFAIALTMFLEALAHLAFGGAPQAVSTPFPGVFNVDGIILNKHRLLVVAVSFFVLMLLALFVKLTPQGRAMRALQQDAYAARLQGIRASRIRIMTFAIGAGFAGLAGGLVAPLQLVLPDIGTPPLLLAFVVVIVGGMGSVAGAFWSALAIGLVQSAVTILIGPQAVIGITFFLAMLVLMAKPTGIFGHDH